MMFLYSHFARTALLLVLAALLVGVAGCQTDSDQKGQPKRDAKRVTVAVSGMS
ncbi:MAG: hypothetical protein L0Y72_06990 [Gemmataceae bacterium]|nr:hypothetical protein [Gemmataceae bacterium]MCI0738771.1 hypothetical protein [Gemmataceae bacterium]